MLFLQSHPPAPILGPSPWPGRSHRVPGHGPGTGAAPGEALPADAQGWSATAGSPSTTTIALPFFASEAQRLRLRLRLAATATLRVETIMPSRMQKAKLTLHGSGTLAEVGEELRDARATRQPDGSLLLEATFLPLHTRPDFLLLHHEAPDAAPLLWRDLEWDSFAVGAAMPSRGHPAASLVDGTLSATRHWAVFRDYLHLEFEVLRPGTELTGLALESALPLEHASWLTAAPVAPGAAPPEWAGLHVLSPRRPAIPFPAPALMDALGPAWGHCGHCIRAVLREPAAMPFLPVAESDAVTALRIHAAFADGTRSIVTPDASMAQIGHWMALHRAALDLALGEGGAGQVFLELGARGPTSAALRASLDPRWRYLGTDIEADPNVDLVADAHQLSAALPHGSVGFCHSNSVMEHLFSPERVVTEVNALLRPGGILFAMVPANWPLHAEPWDYQRYTIHKWPALLNAETGFEVLHAFEASEHSLVPTMPFMPGVTRNQFARAPSMVGVVARKTGEARARWSGWRAGQAAGRYDP